MALWIMSFVVEGDSSFPLDMLRRDECYPDNQDAVIDMAEALEFASVPRRMIQVKLRKLIFKKDDLPNLERWLSFGWRVIPESISVIKI